MDQSSDFQVKGFRAGFICLAGLPSCGKSSLLNAWAQTKLSAVSLKPQTTREHIKVILNGKDYQAVIVDTPGIINPRNLLEKKMSFETKRAIFHDADVFCLMVEPSLSRLKSKSDFFSGLCVKGKSVLLINKTDIYSETEIDESEFFISSLIKFDKIFRISVKTGKNISTARKEIIAMLPLSPPYYPKDQLTDRWERFFAAELIRETIFENYSDEIPYNCAVEITYFKEDSPHGEIHADIHVSKENQKPIIIGHKGKAIKMLRENSTKKISIFLGKKISLFLNVKCTRNWQESPQFLDKFYDR